VDRASGEQHIFSGDKLAAENIFTLAKKIPTETDLYLGGIAWSPNSIFVSGTIYLEGTGDPGIGMPEPPPLATSTFQINTINWTISTSTSL